MKKCRIDNILTKRLTNRANGHSQRTSAIGLFLAVASCAMATGITLGTHDTYAATSTLSLTIDSSTISIDLPANSTGAFAKSGHTTITAATNNVSGYTLKIAATSSTNYNMLVNSSSTACDNSGSNSHSVTGTISSNCFTSIGAATAESTFSDASSTDYNNLWGYLPSKHCTGDVCAANTSFLPAPTPDGDTIDKTTAANTTPNTYTLAIGARVDNSLAVGAYSNTYNVTLVGNAVPYAITYKSGAVSSMPDNVSGTSTSATVNISSTTPTRSGYKFLGWCAGTVTTTNNTDSCSGTTYAAGASYTLDQTGTNDLSLIAMWEPIYTMQQFAAGTASTTCAAMSAGNTITLVDGRDQTPYTIGKFDDGKCWMLDNLALDLTNDTILNSLTADNTNIDTTNDPGALAALKGTTLGTTSDKYATAKVANWTSSYSYSAPLVRIDNKDIVPQGSDPMASTVLAGGWKVGGYYNYCAASAGSYCYGSGTSAGTSSGNATSSICPKGWRLPTSDTGGEFATLYGLYNNYTNFRNAFHLPLSGYFDNGSAYAQGSGGYWWSSTRSTDDRMYRLRANTSNIYPSDGNGRGRGVSVRCVMGS